MKKLLFIYISVFALSLMGFVWMINSAPNPEIAILGEWKELAWEYEKVNRKRDKGNLHKEGQIPEPLKAQIGGNLIMHEAETWTFLPDGRLVFSRDGEEQHTITWRIKGRGHILELRYDQGNVAHYNLTELTNEQLILNFELDTQVKGIAKLTFEKRT